MGRENGKRTRGGNDSRPTTQTCPAAAARVDDLVPGRGQDGVLGVGARWVQQHVEPTGQRHLHVRPATTASTDRPAHQPSQLSPLQRVVVVAQGRTECPCRWRHRRRSVGGGARAQTRGSPTRSAHTAPAGGSGLSWRRRGGVVRFGARGRSGGTGLTYVAQGCPGGRTSSGSRGLRRPAPGLERETEAWRGARKQHTEPMRAPGRQAGGRVAAPYRSRGRRCAPTRRATSAPTCAPPAAP